MKKLLPTILLGLAVLFAPMVGFAARTDALWDYIVGGNYTKPNGSPSGTNLLIYGSDKYINFNTVTGTNGYGFRDNAGTMQWKNSGGAWANISSGGAGSQTPWTSDINGGGFSLTNAIIPDYLSLSSWYATTTDGLDEGLLNKYFSNSLVDTWFSTKPLGLFWSTTSADHWYTLQNRASTTLLGDANTWSGLNTFSQYLTAPYFVANSSTATSTFSGDMTIGQVSILNGNGGANASLLKIVPTKTYGSGSQNQGDGALLVSCSANNGLCAQVTRNNASAVAPLALDYITSASDPYTARSIITAGTGAALTLSQTNSSASQASQTITNAGNGAGLVINMTKTTATSPGLRITATSTNASASTLILEQPFYVTMVLTDLSKNNAQGEGKFQLTNRNDNFRFEGRDNSNLQYSVSGLYNRPNSGGNFVWGGVGDIFSIPTGMATFNVVQSSGTPSYVNVTSTTTSASKYGDIFTILNSGNVGIGTTSPYAKLSVVGEIVGAYFTATTTSNNTFPNLLFTNATGTNATTTRFAISSIISKILKTGADGSVQGASLGTDYVNGSGTNGNCVAWGATNSLTDAGAPCGSGTGGGGASQWATSTLFSNMIHTAGAHGIGIGTTTPKGTLSMASSSAVDMWWNHTGASANSKLGWMSWANGIFNFGTSSDAGATTSLLRLDGGTTTVYAQALTVGSGTYSSSLVQGVGTSTMWGGINLSNGGCFAVSGVCMGTMALTGSIGQVEYFSGVNTAVGTSSLYIATSQNIGVGSTTPFAKLSVDTNTTAGTYPLFVVASSSVAQVTVDSYGSLSVGNAQPTGTVSSVLQRALSFVSVGDGKSNLSEYAMWRQENTTASVGATQWFARSRGTSFASPAVVQNGDVIGDIKFVGWDGADWALGGQITLSTNGTIGSNIMPSRFDFKLSHSLTNSLFNSLTLNSNGSISGDYLSGTSTKTRYMSEPDNISTGVATANYMATYSDDKSRMFQCSTIANTGVNSIRNGSFAATAATNVYHSGGTAQTITMATISGTANHVGRGCITYQGYHYMLLASTTNAAATVIKRADSSDFVNIAVATAWASSTISGVALPTGSFLVGAANGQIWIGTTTIAVQAYTIATSTNTLTSSTYVPLAGAGVAINTTRVNNNGIYAGFGSAPYIRKYTLAGVAVVGPNYLAAAPSTTGPDLFVMANSVYAISGSLVSIITRLDGY